MLFARTRFVSLAFVALAIAACQGDEPDVLEEATEYSVLDFNRAELEADAAVDGIEAVVLAPGSGKTSHNGVDHIRFGECIASVSYDTVRAAGNTAPKRVVITFAPALTCDDGKVRSGQIVATWRGYLRQASSPGTELVITTNSYVVNGHLHKLRRVISTSLPAGQPAAQTVTSVDTLVLAGGEGTAYSTTQRTRTWVAGFGTASPFDDVFTLTGFSTGRNRRGESYRAEITQPLRIERNCRSPISGTLSFTADGSVTRELSFGATTCDNLATLRIGNQSSVITLP